MKKFGRVLASKWLHVCLVAGFITLSTAVLAQAQVQDDDVISPTELAGMGIKFTHVGPPTAKNG
jgi:hypothetical protein